jgi:hypothetical protein
MLTIKCKEKGQHKLYNCDIVDSVCFCRTCGLTPPNLFAKVCDCSGCIPEDIPPIPRAPPPPTDLSKIPAKDRISIIAQGHGVATLTKFRKDIWRADDNNSLLHPDAYLSDRLMKEILDKFSTLKSVEAVANILAPHKRIRNQEHALFALLTTLQVDFDAFAAEKKAENAAKRKATAAAKAADKEVMETPESGATHSNDHTDDDIDVSQADVGSDIAGPSQHVP